LPAFSTLFGPCSARPRKATRKRWTTWLVQTASCLLTACSSWFRLRAVHVLGGPYQARRNRARAGRQEKKKKWEPPPPPPRVGRKQRRAAQASSLGSKLPAITPNAKCKLRLLKLERVKDWLLMEQEFVANQERLKPQEERNEVDRSKARAAPPPTGVRVG